MNIPKDCGGVPLLSSSVLLCMPLFNGTAQEQWHAWELRLIG